MGFATRTLSSLKASSTRDIFEKKLWGFSFRKLEASAALDFHNCW